MNIYLNSRTIHCIKTAYEHDGQITIMFDNSKYILNELQGNSSNYYFQVSE